MRRKLLLAAVAALMLTLTAGAAAPVAGASTGDAQVAKKRGSKRAARCKARRGKGKKAKGRRAEGAAAKRKPARCKAKRKPKRKRAAPKRGAGSADGFYEDTAHSVTFRVTGSTAEATFPLPGDCFSGIGVRVDGDATASASTLRASGTTIGGGGYLTIPWSITVKLPSLSYVLDVMQSTSFPDQSPCRGGGKITGTLVKK